MTTRPTSKKCAVCKRPFKGRRNKVYCGDGCKMEANNAKARERRMGEGRTASPTDKVKNMVRDAAPELLMACVITLHAIKTKKVHKNIEKGLEMAIAMALKGRETLTVTAK
jgi:hypothetical protein